MSAPELRRITEDTYPGFIRNLERTFGFDFNPEEDSLRPVLDLDRAFGHFDDGVVVSTVAAFSLDMTVPGGVVPCGGTTVVTVSPTHRRRGLLTEMMDRHLEDVRERGEPIAALWASESEIYGRFGYGRASQSVEITIHGRGRALSRHSPNPSPVRLVEVDEAEQLVPPYHDRHRKGQPGMFARTPEWWESRVFRDLQSRRAGATAARWAVVDGNDGIEGYAKYRVKGGPGEDGHSGSELIVTDLLGSTPNAWAGLWSFLLNQDLIARFTARLRSEQDPIFDLLAGPRRAQSRVTDGVWVRVMDIPTALAARSYQAEFSGVLAVDDPLGISGGTFAIEAGPDGCECRPTTADADITLDIEDLGSAYLGAAGFRRMARAGRVTGSDRALADADLAFGWDPQPWCPEIF